VSRRRKRVVVLGGGAGALSAAYALSGPGWQKRYESITVYQRGWRLGGKGASGRGVRDRIEEHGLHIWFGFYRNAFAMLDGCYRERGQARERAGQPAAAFPTVAEAFEPASTFVLTGRREGAWEPWIATFPEGGDPPWAPAGDPPSVWELVKRALGLALAAVRSARSAGERDTALGGVRLIPVDGDDAAYRPAEVRLVPQPLGAARPGAVFGAARTGRPPSPAGAGPLPGAPHGGRRPAASPRRLQAAESLVGDALTMARALDDDPSRHSGDEHGLLAEVLAAAVAAVTDHLRPLAGLDEQFGRQWEVADLLLACVRGVLADGVLQHGTDVVDDRDFAEWLVAHGADPESARGVLVTAVVYDLAFAYRDGDPRTPSCSAGVALRGLARLFFDYTGAIAWKMRAGMGDVVFAPLYSALRERGVRFEFFSRVDALWLSADGTRVAEIEIGRQLGLADGVGGYEPLIDVGGLPSWPAEPRWEQLRNPHGASAASLESFWAQVPDAGREVLSDGDDFDEVVLGVGLGALPALCADLVERVPRWKDMVDNLATVHTQAFQLWLSRTPDELLDACPGAVTGGFTEPFDTYADMRQLIERESWDGAVRGIAYFCNVLETPPGHTDPQDRMLPARAHERVRLNAIRFLEQDAGVLWPGAALRYPPDFCWDLLVDHRDGGGQDEAGVRRFDSQFWRANVDPSDRYVLSLPGTARFRLPPGDSGVANLFLAGDWTECGLDAGCVEAAVTSGLLAGNAMCGNPALGEIVGHDHLRGPR
jgi:uncharacterized protein with NAD-binding domain and iron-sulfur cluster